MISVCVSINTTPILARSARNTGHVDDLGRHVYEVDDGSTLLHRREDGAAALAIALLKTIKDPGV